MIKPWPLQSSTPLSDLGLFKITRDRATSPRTGQDRDFLVIHMPDWLQVVPLTTEGRLVLVRQYRHGSRRVGLEVPGGLLDPQDPDPAAAAARELREETGYGGGSLHPLGAFWPQPAMLANRVHFFVAVDLELQGDLQPDAGEDLEVVLVDPAEVEGLAAAGEIQNVMTVTALALARQAGRL